jgi:hypothetical protein
MVGGKAFALLFFVLLSAAFTWPLVAHMDNSLPDWGDAADSAKNIGSIALQLRTDPLNLYDSRFAYPLKNSLTLGELMTGQGLLAAPIIWATDSIPLAFNLLNFSSYVLSGFGVWLLVRHLTGSGAAGLVAGMVFAFSPWHYSQYAHLGLGAQHWMVFALFFLILFMESTAQGLHLITRQSLLYLGLFTAFFVLQALASGYYAYYEAILVGIYLLYYALFTSGARLRFLIWRPRQFKTHNSKLIIEKRLAGQLSIVVLACVVALVLLLPFALPYVQTKNEYGFKRALEEANYFSAGPKSLLLHSPNSWLYGPVEVGALGRTTGPEGEMYPGVVAVFLALTGLFGAGKNRTPRSAFAGPWLFGAVSVIGLVLSFGPSLNWDLYTREMTGITLPYAWLYDHMPGWDSMRVPHRFALLFMLGLAVCAGYGVARLVGLEGGGQKAGSRKQWAKGYLLPSAFCFLVGVDFFAGGLPAVYTPVGDATPPLYRWLAGSESTKTIPKDALLLELPITDYEHPVTSKPIYLVYGLAHGRPMLNASINIIPPGFERFHYDMQQFPAAGTLDVMEALGAKFVIVHTGQLPSEDRLALQSVTGPQGRLDAVAHFPASTGDPQFEDIVYRVKPDPQRVAKLAAALPPGASVMLSEDISHKHLYTNALARLLGPTWRYFSQYSTIYDQLLGNIRPATPQQFYDRAILYKEAVIYYNGSAGYAPTEAIQGAENDLVQVYKKVYQR